MSRVITPIPDDLRKLALSRVPPQSPEALEKVKGSEHLLLDSGLAAHLGHMLDIPSLSPAVADRAVDVATAVEAKLKEIQNLVPAKELHILKRYADALWFIAEVGFFQSRFLIEYLRQEMVDRPMAERLGVTLEQLPMTVQLLKLARQNSDGTPWVDGEAWRDSGLPAQEGHPVPRAATTHDDALPESGRGP